ncbi:MAG TPA: choice-of-anchor Q domain-containing protein [Waterburya sp.]|jgi:hypothetical protein
MSIITVTSATDNGVGSLRDAIATAQSGDTIQFASTFANQTITLTSGQLEISVGKNLIIDGAGVSGLTLSGNNQSRIFHLQSTSVNPTSLTLKNLTLANGFTNEFGGAIRTEHQGKLTVENSQFKNNVASQGGGAIFGAYEGIVTVTGSKFDSNTATASNDERGGGAIATWGGLRTTVTGSEFTNNAGINGGAINNLAGELVIEGSKFINNSTIAGAVATGQENPTLRGYGGAVYSDRGSNINSPTGTISISNSVFDGNKGRGEGGAAYLYSGNQDSVLINSSTFKNNEVLALPGGNGGNGGAVVQMSNGANKGFTISNTSFANNIAASQGGGLWMMDAPTTITNSTFSGNKAQATDYNGNGGAMSLYGPTNIINTTIANNYAGWVGGGVAANDSPVTVQNTIFANNTAANGNNNWGIQQQTSRLLTDGGGNIQFPPKSTNNSNDFNATASITIADPKLGALQEINGHLVHPLLAGSAAINAGVSVAGLTTDELGTPRSDGKIDIGAFEFGGTLAINAPSTVGNALLASSAGNDSLIGGIGNNTLRGWEGNDSLTGVNPATNAGTGEMDTLIGGTGADQFILGNATTVFYNDGILSNAGQSDYAVIADFNHLEDTIVLHGSASSYQLGVLGTDTGVFYTAGQTTNELIGVVQGVSPEQLNLTDSSFKYV